MQKWTTSISLQISKEVEVNEGCATYALGDEVFISKHKLHPRRQVYVQALNYMSYEFSKIPTVLNTIEVIVSANQQYYWLKQQPPNDGTCCFLLKNLAKQNRVRAYI